MRKVILSLIVFFCLLICAGCGGGGGSGAGGGGGFSSIDQGTLQGRLLDEQNWGIKDATIRLDPGDHSAKTGNDGFFSMMAPVNHYKLTIIYNQETFYVPQDIDVIKDKSVSVNLYFSPVEGFIISHPVLGLAFVKNISLLNLGQLGYTPLSGAQINLSGASQSLTTDSGGHFKYDRVLMGIQSLEVLYGNKNIKENIVVTAKTDISDIGQTNALPENVSMLVGSVRQFTAYGLNGKSELVLPSQVNWRIADNIGTMNADGVFVAQNIGRTQVFGSFGGTTVSANVIVTSGMGNIKGRVTDGITGQPVSNVIVNVSGVSIFDVTDQNGDFSLSGIPANLNVLLSVTDGGTLLASKTVFVIPDTTVTADLQTNSPSPTPTSTPSSTGHPLNNSVLTTIQVGKSPKGIVITPDGLKAYVATELGTYYFSTLTNQVNGSIQIGSSPFNKKISMSPDGLRAYVTNNGPDPLKVAFINTADNSIADSVTSPQSPFDVQVSPDGKKFYVANEDQAVSSVYVIDTSTKSFSSIQVDKIPHGLGISPDGHRLYVTSIVTAHTPVDLVSVINTDTASVLNTISVGAVPYEIALSPDGKKAWVTNSGGNTVSVIDTATNSVAATIPVGSAPLSVAVSPDGTRVFVTHFDDHVSVIDGATNSVVTTIKLSGTVGEDVTFSPDGLRAYVTTSGGGGLVQVIY